jgi:uncharacterized protein (TIGR02265 family)
LHLFETCLDLTAQELYPNVPRASALHSLGEAHVDAFVRTCVGRSDLLRMKHVGVRHLFERFTISCPGANNYLQALSRKVAPDTIELWVNEAGRQPQSTQGAVSRFLQLITSREQRVTMMDYDGHSCRYLVELDLSPGEP